jgi:hypothetical protein
MTFEVPWGSESICYWCTKNGRCRMFDSDVKVYLLKVSGDTLDCVSFADVLKRGPVTSCPIREFDADYSKLPEQFRGMRIVEAREGKKI